MNLLLYPLTFDKVISRCGKKTFELGDKFYLTVFDLTVSEGIPWKVFVLN